MSALADLDAYVADPANGIVDLKLFPGMPGDEHDAEREAAFTLRLLRGEIPCIDITGEPL